MGKRHPTSFSRLDRALSKLGVASRAAARRLIADGRVSVGRIVIIDPGRLVALSSSTAATRIAVDGVAIRPSTTTRHLVLHKPRGVVTTRRDPDGRPTVFDLLGDDAAGLLAVGRLDLASSGLLVMTTDSQLANWLTDPANGVVRRYVVTVRGEVTEDDIATQAQTYGASIELRKRSRRETHLIVELTEGKNREIRRMFAGVGHEVTRLLRVSFGPFELGSLPPGKWRDATSEEIAAIFACLGPV